MPGPSLDDWVARQRDRIAGVLLVIGCATFWACWALMPMPGTTDPAFILDAVAAARPAVLASCILQLVSAAAWAVALVLAPAPAQPPGRLAWWLGACLLAVGSTASAADAIYHLAAFELTHPEVAPELALPVMKRLQGPDLLLLLPGVGALVLGLGLFAVAGARTGLIPRASLWLLAAPLPGAAARLLLPGDLAPRVVALALLAAVITPVGWMGWRLARGRGESR
jgi:hypothetical protein